MYKEYLGGMEDYKKQDWFVRIQDRIIYKEIFGCIQAYSILQFKTKRTCYESHTDQSHLYPLTTLVHPSDMWTNKITTTEDRLESQNNMHKWHFEKMTFLN